MSALVTSARVVDLVPVRNMNGTHFARRDSKLGIEAGPALCGAMGDLDRYSRPRWRRVSGAKKVCNACHARACAMPTRVHWS